MRSYQETICSILSVLASCSMFLLPKELYLVSTLVSGFFIGILISTKIWSGEEKIVKRRIGFKTI